MSGSVPSSGSGRKRRAGVGWVALALALAACAPASPPGPPAPRAPSGRSPEPPPPACERIVALAVHKAERELVATCARGAVVRLRVALGREPEGPKRREGDRRTPEGLYHVVDTGRPSRFHRFVPLDYPSPGDADVALAEGRISPRDHRRILRAHEAGRMPPADTPLGGAIGLHGEGERWRGDSADLDWTEGCIAMPDADVDFLAERIDAGTPVRILPRAPDPPGRSPVP